MFFACSRSESVQISVGSGSSATGGGTSGAGRLLGWQRPPKLAAETPPAIAAARLSVLRIRWDELRARSDSDRLPIDTLPFLSATPEGQTFLAATGPRILVRGEPAAICPAMVALTPVPGTDRARMVEDGLAACFARLASTHPDCGCQVVALEDMLTVPATDMAYATGIAARLHIAALGIDDLLVAERDAQGETLRDLRAVVGRIERAARGAVIVTFADGRSFAGESRPVGYRRGRIAERIYGTDAAGNRMSLLIGFSPDELAAGAARYLAWPRDIEPRERLAGG